MLEYSEYKSIIDILDKSELDDSYKDLMKKEDKVLDTVNHVVNSYNDKKIKRKQFIHMSLYEIYNLFFLEWPSFMKDVTKATSLNDVFKLMIKNNRIIYLGCILVFVSFILFFIDSSK